MNMKNSFESGRTRETHEAEKKPIRTEITDEDMRQVAREGMLKVTRSSAGPGGQNVNKTAKTAEFRWIPSESQVFNDDEKALIIDWMNINKPSQFVGDGEIYLTSTRERSLEANKKDVMELLESYLSEALTLDKERIPTTISRGAKERRLDDKARSSAKKAARGKVDFE